MAISIRAASWVGRLARLDAALKSGLTVGQLATSGPILALRGHVRVARLIRGLDHFNYTLDAIVDDAKYLTNIQVTSL